jgi:hypothetical protein
MLDGKKHGKVYYGIYDPFKEPYNLHIGLCMNKWASATIISHFLR